MPWTLPIRTAQPTLSLEIVRYQRDLYPAFHAEAQHGFQQIIVQINREGNPAGFISSNEYEYDFVTVAVYYEAVGTAPVSRRDLIEVLEKVKAVPLEFGPRELMARIRGNREVMGNMFLQWKGVEHGFCRVGFFLLLILRLVCVSSCIDFYLDWTLQ